VDADAGRVDWVFALGVAALIAAAPAGVARRRGHGPGTLVLVFVLHSVSVIVFGAGALALVFNGYVEDYGMEPARTLHFAIPLLASGALVTAAAWYIAGRRPG
jgi:membrane protein DedA with SNARE-associated domain